MILMIVFASFPSLLTSSSQWMTAETPPCLECGSDWNTAIALQSQSFWMPDLVKPSLSSRVQAILSTLAFTLPGDIPDGHTPQSNWEDWRYWASSFPSQLSLHRGYLFHWWCAVGCMTPSRRPSSAVPTTAESRGSSCVSSSYPLWLHYLFLLVVFQFILSVVHIRVYTVISCWKNQTFPSIFFLILFFHLFSSSVLFHSIF